MIQIVLKKVHHQFDDDFLKKMIHSLIIKVTEINVIIPKPDHIKVRSITNNEIKKIKVLKKCTL